MELEEEEKETEPLDVLFPRPRMAAPQATVQNLFSIVNL